MSATLGVLFGSMVVYILIKSTCKRSIGAVDTIRCWGTLDNLPSCCKQCVQDFGDFCIWLAHSWSTRRIPATGTGFDHTLDALHLSDTNSRWQHMMCLGDHKEQEIISFALGCMSVGIRPPDESQNSVSNVGSGYHLNWRWVLPEVPLNLSSSVPLTNPTLCSTSSLLSGLWPSQ